MATRGTWTEDAIVYAIKSDLEEGMRTTSNSSFSLEHLRTVIYGVRNELIKELHKQNQLFDELEVFQEVNCIPLDCENFSLCKSLDTKDPSLHFTMPHYTIIDYIGTPRQDVQFKIYNSHASTYNKYRNKALVNRPYVRLRQYSGELHGFVFNPPTPNMKYLSIRAAFENPRDVNKYSCCTYNPREDRFPLPDNMVDRLIQRIVGRWSQIYRNFNRIDTNNNPPLKNE